MSNINLRKFEGKSISELEKEVLLKKHSQPFRIIHPSLFGEKLLMIFILGFSLLLVAIVGLSWDLKQHRDQLNRDVVQLQTENDRLKKELEQKNLEFERFKQQPTNQPAIQGGSLIYHHIQAGENFALISKKYYGTEVFAGKLAEINFIHKGTRLHVGQVIKVPKEPEKSWGK